MEKQTQIGLELVRLLAQEGDRIFTTERALSLSRALKLKPSYLNEVLFLLKNNNWIHPIKRGLYYLDSTMMVGGPIHEFEIGTALVKPSMISHFSALHYHHLTDQIPQTIYVSTSKKLGNFSSQRKLNGITYHLIQTKPEHYFGETSVWIGEAKVSLSDYERTLIDSIRNPQFCGGFSEVLAAYESAKDKINLTTIIGYALQLETSTIKRLGWMLAFIGYNDNQISPLEKVPIKGFRKLDASRESFGPYNKKWRLIENI